MDAVQHEITRKFQKINDRIWQIEVETEQNQLHRKAADLPSFAITNRMRLDHVDQQAEQGKDNTNLLDGIAESTNRLHTSRPILCNLDFSGDVKKLPNAEESAGVNNLIKQAMKGTLLCNKAIWNRIEVQ